MHEDKKRRLKKLGWRIGSASDFLELTAAEAAYVEIKLNLGRQLRKRRSSSKLTQTQLAERLRSSQSRVARMEAGDPSVSLDLLIRCLLELGASPGDLARTITSSAQRCSV
jgi:DNA-binding XRE family transcriptional regulator